MSKYFAQRILLNKKILILINPSFILGLSFKENCPDIRNSKVFDLFKELISFNINVDVYDPVVNSNEVKSNHGLNLTLKPKNSKYDLIVITVPHQVFKDIGIKNIKIWCNEKGSIMDLKNTFPQNTVDYSI